jgi:UDP-sulfoquinovose synthase
LQDIGVKPHYLTEQVMEKMFNVVAKYKGNIREDVIFHGVRW